MRYTVVEPLTILAGAVPIAAYGYVRDEIASSPDRKIITEHDPKPIPDRCFDWSAIDADTYDGAEDSKTRGQVGFGATEAEAIGDLKRVLEEAGS